jgi:small GTP-binding protein
MNTYCKYVTKIIFIGDECIGKTAICDYLTNNMHTKSYEKTVCVNYITYNTAPNHQLLIWDITGDRNYLPFTKQYFNGSDVICIFFNSTNSFQSIDFWHKSIIDNTAKTPIIFIINIQFNKKNISTVNSETAKKKAVSMGAFYYELNKSNIYDLFDIIAFSFNTAL